MKLLVISHMPHYRDATGRIVGWGPTAQELDHLATRFSHVRHIACLHDGAPPPSFLPYAATNLELVPVRPSGADGFIGKLDVLRHSPEYVRTILRELPAADMVHVRAPAHIAMIAIGILSARRTPHRRWIKYAGNWKPDEPDAVSYRMQREWLSRPYHRSIVTINGEWSDQPPWVKSFFNPSLLAADREAGRRAAAARTFATPLRMIFVGVLSSRKGTGRGIEVLAELTRRGVAATLDIVGDGSERPQFEDQVRALGLRDRTHFHGWLPKTRLGDVFAPAHVQVFPSATEGWPKVLSEGMAYGVVPIASAVSSIPQYLARFQTGTAVPTEDVRGFADAIAALARDPERWRRESTNALVAAHWFTYDHYLSAIDDLLEQLR